LVDKKQLILIIEDNKMNIQILVNIMKGTKHQIAIAKNGKNALKFVKKRFPDLILLDIMIPGIDGYKVCEKLKNDDLTKEIPIIFISALNDVKDKLKGFKLGAVDYISKPFQEKEVLARINTHLKLKSAKEKLQQDNKWFKTLFENATEPIIIFDKNHCIVDINDEFKKVFRYQLNEVKGMDIDDVMEKGKKNAANREGTKLLLSGKQVQLEEKRYSKNGVAIDCLIKGIPVIIDGKLAGGFVMYVDITEIKKKEEKIRYISLHDKMTGLYNRRYFEDEMSRINKSRRLPVSLIVADIDGLKKINDNYGHKKGDEYIKRSADIINSVTRSADIVARIGGDEFAVILPHTGKKVASEVVKRIQEICKKESYKSRNKISISAAYAVKDNQSKSLNEVFKQADENMYDLKRKRYFHKGEIRK